jgi:hypothetical protein
MCRQKLATREHMLDSGQLGLSTPANVTPASSRGPPTDPATMAVTVPSMMTAVIFRLRQLQHHHRFRPSLLQFGSGGMSNVLMMSSMIMKDVDGSDSGKWPWSYRLIYFIIHFICF